MIKFCHMWTRYVTWKWVISYSRISSGKHWNEKCHHYEMGHVTHMIQFCDVWTSYVTEERVMSQLQMRHVTHWNEFCHRYEGVMSQIWPGHIKHINTSCDIWTSLDTRMTRHIPLRNKPRYIWMSHVTHMHESCHIHQRVMSHKHTYTVDFHRHKWHLPADLARASSQEVFAGAVLYV